jgi:hypothetical protein
MEWWKTSFTQIFHPERREVPAVCGSVPNAIHISFSTANPARFDASK